MNTGISVTANLMSAAAFGAVDIMFYVNLGLAFFGLVIFATLIALYKKTICSWPLALVGIIVLAASVAMYFVQLSLYAEGIVGTECAVYVCTAVFGAGFVVSGVYFVCLSRNSDKILCIVTGVLCLVPPAGAITAIFLSRRIERDTPAKKRVFSGYAYTYAAIEAFAEENAAELIDGSGEEEFVKLSAKDAKRLLKKLRAVTIKQKSAEAKYRYASALVYYAPYKFNIAFKIMEKLAVDGYAPALFNIGYFYETGTYTKRDYKKAREFYKRAEAAGDGDAPIRLAITDIKSGKAAEGLAVLSDLARKGNDTAKYDMGVCLELGLGTEKDIVKAFDFYTDCANANIFVAQKRIFAAAGKDISAAHNGDFFRSITDKFFVDASFATMIDGLIEIKKRHAADASKHFLDAVKLGGKWEGVARCLVGTLYIDCGKLANDRKNGVEYIKSALKLWSGAGEIYATLPKKIR